MNNWWLPPAISSEANGFDVQFVRTFVAASIIFVAAQCALVFIVWRYRRRVRTASPGRNPANSRLEYVWTTATACLFLGLLFLGGHVWASVQFTPAPAFNTKRIPLAPETDISTDLNIDSVSVMDFVMEVEDHFNIEIPLNVLGETRTMSDLVKVVESRVKGPDA